MSKTVLITGGRGFLGSHLAARLIEENWAVHITSRDSPTAIPPDVSVHRVDMADPSQAEEIIDTINPDLVYHFAGAVSARPDLDLADMIFRSHVISAHNLLILASSKNIERLILCGSMMEMLDQTPSSPYAAAKGVTRLYGEMFSDLWATPVVVVRPFMTFGPGQGEDKVLPYVIRSLYNGDVPKLGDGTWRADWIYVSDVVEGMFKAAVVPGIEGAVLDLGRGKLVSLREMVENVAALMKSDVSLDFGARTDRPNEPVRTADVKATKATLGWEPVVDIQEGLLQTIASYTDRDVA